MVTSGVLGRLVGRRHDEEGGAPAIVSTSFTLFRSHADGRRSSEWLAFAQERLTAVLFGKSSDFSVDINNVGFGIRLGLLHRIPPRRVPLEPK